LSDPENFFYESSDRLRLYARLHGSPHQARLPVVCLPGLTRNSRDFSKLSFHLTQKSQAPRQVIAFDYRGRGQSQHDADWRNYTIQTELADTLIGLAKLGIDRAFFVGTSRGGLITQVLATTRPSLIAGSVLNDIGPVIEPEGLALIRAYLSQSTWVESRAAAIAVQKRTHGSAFPALTDADWEGMADGIYRVEKGRLRPDYDPDLVQTLTINDPNQPLPQLWKEFDALAARPVLAIRGANSRLLSAATLAEMARRGSRVQIITVEGQGHAPLLHTAGLPQLVDAFLQRAEADDGFKTS
jgi:pimeloyl-ACP methyl ester carboxylesterase